MLNRWRHELGVPVRARSPASSGKAGGPVRATATIAPADLGTLLHRCMEGLDFSNPQSAGRLVLAAAEELQLPEDVSREEIAKEFQPMLDVFLRHDLGRQLTAAKDRIAEVEFILREGAVRLAGKIDMLWRDDGGAWHLLDYKSDRAEGEDLADYSRRYELQMAAYALAASRYLAGAAVAPPVADATLYFLRPGKTHVMRLEGGRLSSAEERLAEIASRLIAARRSGQFPRCAKPACRYCAYGRYCEAVAGEEEHSEA
jgi:RecB family exonuclease